MILFVKYSVLCPKELYRKVISILNKLTPQKFQTLTKQILELEIDTPERLEGVIDRIFEKVCNGNCFLTVLILCKLRRFVFHFQEVCELNMILCFNHV